MPHLLPNCFSGNMYQRNSQQQQSIRVECLHTCALTTLSIFQHQQKKKIDQAKKIHRDFYLHFLDWNYRILLAIFFSSFVNCVLMSLVIRSPLLISVQAKSLQLCLTLCNPMTFVHQAPLSVGFSRQEYWSGLPCPHPRDLPDPGIKPMSPALVGRFITTSITWENFLG